MNKRKLFGVAMCLSITFLQAESINDITFSYHNSKNTVERKHALGKLSTLHEQPEATIAVPGAENEDVTKLLREALNDPSPTVVEKAIQQIGILRLQSMANDLDKLYKNADEEFGAYSERIKMNILNAAGNLKGIFAAKLFTATLEKDFGNPLSETALNSIEKLEDPSMIPVLETFADKMENIVRSGKKDKINPLLYSEALGKGSKARAIIQNLSSRGGN